jgi:hypothetical protein
VPLAEETRIEVVFGDRCVKVREISHVGPLLHETHFLEKAGETDGTSRLQTRVHFYRRVTRQFSGFESLTLGVMTVDASRNPISLRRTP